MFPEITSKGQKVSLEIKLGCNLKNKKNYDKEKISKRHKEYFKLYQVVPTTPQEKEQNRQALAAANAMRAKQMVIGVTATVV